MISKTSRNNTPQTCFIVYYSLSNNTETTFVIVKFKVTSQCRPNVQRTWRTNELITIVNQIPITQNVALPVCAFLGVQLLYLPLTLFTSMLTTIQNKRV